jgi:hypothetical protein
MTQLVEHLPSTCKALSSNLSIVFGEKSVAHWVERILRGEEEGSTLHIYIYII